jgi:CheY-like chemotaxis protein
MQKLSSVLLVDDDEITNFLNAHLLDIHEVTDQVLVACNGQEALALLARLSDPPASSWPALVLLDLNMSVMGGIEFLEAYQRLPAAPALCVAVLTSSVHVDDLARLQAWPLLAVLHKPLTEEKITTLLQQYAQHPLVVRSAAG